MYLRMHRWVQPCRAIGLEWVWRPVLTRDMAALRIQNTWRAIQVSSVCMPQIHALPHPSVCERTISMHVCTRYASQMELYVTFERPLAHIQTLCAN